MATAFFGSLLLGGFRVDPDSTLVGFRQDGCCLTVGGADTVGGTLGGLFAAPQNWQGLGALGLRAALSGENPNAFFVVEVFSGDGMDLVASYMGSTHSLPTSGEPSLIGLSLIETGPGDFSDVRGIQFTWSGSDGPGSLSLSSFAALSPSPPELLALASEALSMLASGVPWPSLAPEQQRAHAQLYPSQAVSLGGAAALNMVPESLLTPQLVYRYVRHGGSWKEPYLYNANVNPSTLVSFSGSWPGWGRSFPVVRVTNSLSPVEEVGSVSIVPVVSNGRLAGYYYNAELAPGASGVALYGSPSGYGTGYGSVNFSGGELRVLRPW